MGKRSYELCVALKHEIIDSIAKKSGHTRKDCKVIYDALFDTLTEKFADGKAVHIATFGNFEVRVLAGKETRHPITREPMYITERNTLKFKPAKKVKNAINGIE